MLDGDFDVVVVFVVWIVFIGDGVGVDFGDYVFYGVIYVIVIG